MVEQAGFLGLLRTLLIILLVYYGVKFLLRILVPMIFRPPGRGNSAKNNVNTNKSSSKSKGKKDSGLGEYVDYEEVE